MATPLLLPAAVNAVVNVVLLWAAATWVDLFIVWEQSSTSTDNNNKLKSNTVLLLLLI